MCLYALVYCAMQNFLLDYETNRDLFLNEFATILMENIL